MSVFFITLAENNFNMEEDLKVNLQLNNENQLSEEFHLKKLAAETTANLIMARVAKNSNFGMDDIEKRFPAMYDIIYAKIKKQNGCCGTECKCK